MGQKYIGAVTSLPNIVVYYILNSLLRWVLILLYSYSINRNAFYLYTNICFFKIIFLLLA